MPHRLPVLIRRVLPAALLSGAVLLAGCAGTQAGTAEAPGSAAPAGTDAEPATSTAASDDDVATDAPPFPADVSPHSLEPSADSMVTVTDIRIGRHEGYDRVVFEVGGTGTPGWDVRYVDEAYSQGSGDPVEVDGDAVLQVSITGTGYPYDTGLEEYSGPDPLTAAGTEVVREVVFDATYEGATVAFLGASAQTPFRVYALQDPARVVVEVQDQA